MTPLRVHAIFGLVLILGGFLFDFGFVSTSKNFQALQQQPTTYLSSFLRYAHELTRFYLFVLGFLNLAFAWLTPHAGGSERMKWIVLGLLLGGSILFIAGGLWEARRTSPIFEWEPACYVLGVGLFAIVLSLAVEIHLLSAE